MRLKAVQDCEEAPDSETPAVEASYCTLLSSGAPSRRKALGYPRITVNIPVSARRTSRRVTVMAVVDKRTRQAALMVNVGRTATTPALAATAPTTGPEIALILGLIASVVVRRTSRKQRWRLLYFSCTDS